MTEQLQEAGFKEAGDDFWVLPVDAGILCLKDKGNNYIRFTQRVAYIAGLGEDEILFEGILDVPKILNIIDPETHPLETKSGAQGHWITEAGVQRFADHDNLETHKVNTLIKNADHAYTKSRPSM
jgi:hypothetical protein